MSDLADYVYEVAIALGLGGWELAIERDDPENDAALASIAVSFGRKQAHIALGPAFDACTPEEQRETIVHELLHAHHAAVDELMDNALPKAMSPETHSLFMEAYRILVERALDPLAVALAVMDGPIPLPPAGE